MNKLRQSGLTVLELLITLAILGVLMGVGYIAMRPNHALITAQEMQAMMRNARFEAVRLTRPVEVAWGTDANGVSTIQAFVLEPPSFGNFDIRKQPICGAAGGQRVPSGSITSEFKAQGEYLAKKNIRFDHSGSVYWLPNGIAWNCNTHKPVDRDYTDNVPHAATRTVIRSGANHVATVSFIGSFDVTVFTGDVNHDGELTQP